MTDTELIVKQLLAAAELQDNRKIRHTCGSAIMGRRDEEWACTRCRAEAEWLKIAIPLRQAAAALEAIRAENERLRAVVCEVANSEAARDCGCPVCKRLLGRHNADCRLAALLPAERAAIGERHDA